MRFEQAFDDLTFKHMESPVWLALISTRGMTLDKLLLSPS